MKTTSKTKKPRSKLKNDQKTDSLTRIDAVVIALKEKKPKTIQDWVTKTNEIYGQKNDKQSLKMIRYISKALIRFNIDHPKK